MYATFLQWWRLGALKNKLQGTLTPQNALLVCNNTTLTTPTHARCLENLLIQNKNRILCTVVPRQNVNLNNWAAFPKDFRYFPIHINAKHLVGQVPTMHYILIESKLDHFVPHNGDIVEIERFGELLAWKANHNFEIILKTDLENITKLIYWFSNNNIDINHELELLKIELVDIHGTPSKIKYDTKYTLEQTLRYSLLPSHWNDFVTSLRDLYFKIHALQPKIYIENGTKANDVKKIPISEVKPMKKEVKKKVEANKNTLDVHSSKRKDHKDKDGHHKNKEIPKNKDKVISEVQIKIDNVIDIPVVSTEPVLVPKEIKKVSEAPVISTAVETPKLPIEDAKKAEAKTATNSTNKKDSVLPSTSKLKLSLKSHDETKQSKTKFSTTEQKKEEKLKHDKEKKMLKNSSRQSKTEVLSTSSTPSKQPIRSYSDAVQSTSPKKDDKAVPIPIDQKKNKPTNILVYAESTVAKDNVKSVLQTIVNNEKYTIYDLPAVTSASINSWKGTTNLVIVCGNVNSELTNQLLQYLVTGGQLLCLCSDLLYSVLQTFSTAEVREHELVRFSYGEWRRVKMMHHVFCYQASPAKKQFSKDSECSSASNGSSPVAPRTPAIVEIQHGGKSYVIQVQVLGSEETWQTPSLLLANVKNSKGKAFFSQVHLEVDPTQYQDDENKYAALKDSNNARLEILKDILSRHLDIDCNNPLANIKFTPAYFLGTFDFKMDLLKNNANIVENKLVNDKLILNFIGNNQDPGTATLNRLPVMVHSCPTNFSTIDYFENLKSTDFGRLVIYSDIISSTQHVLDKKLRHGFVVIARQQTNGIGRSKNVWISPNGSCTFSIQIHVPLQSVLGRALSLIQHFAMVAIVDAIKSIEGYEGLDIGIKWPNDLYAAKQIKLGGILTTSTIHSDVAIINIGCGINLSNSDPTTCINDLIKEYNRKNGTQLKQLPYEKFLAVTFSRFEDLFNSIQKNGTDELFPLYYKHWLHSDAEVTVSTSAGDSKQVKILGIDQYGFLEVESSSGEKSSVQSDGNSFDMLKGLIAPKIF